jgi:Uma2 family endonuclease
MVDHPIEQTGLMTIEEFVRLYDTEGPFELIEGERIPLSPTVAKHNTSAKVMYDALRDHDRSEQNGVVFFEAPFVLTITGDWVKGSRVPDVMYFRAERLAAYKNETPDWGDKPFVLVPDIVVEVISSNDSYSDVDNKVDRYLQDGVQLVWVVDPKRKTVTVRRINSYRKLKGSDILTGEDIIPGFKLAVSALFG